MKYEPEIGQAIFGAPTAEFEFPEFAEALLFGAFKEIERVYWNKNQEEWENYEDLGFKEIVVNPYYWGDKDKELAKPNFKFEDIEIRWYKYPGRGMSCNKQMSSQNWADWYERLLNRIRENEPELF